MMPFTPATLLILFCLLSALLLLWWQMAQPLQPEPVLAVRQEEGGDVVWRNWQTLQQWLQGRGVDTSAWGHGRAKTPEHLWRELLRGETQLLPNPTRRVVELVVLIVRRGDHILLETGQQLADGRFRERAWPPSEKMQRGETYMHTAVRGLREELGLAPHEYTLHPHSYYTCHHWRESLSYPTLPAQYCFHIIEVDIPGLPPEPFTTAESTHSTDEAVAVHHWAWRKPSSAVVSLLSQSAS